MSSSLFESRSAPDSLSVCSFFLFENEDVEISKSFRSSSK